MTASSQPPVLEARMVRKTYRRGAIATEVLKGVDLSVARGEFLSVVGASGSGKSTLLHLAGGLENVTAGQVLVNGRDLSTLSAAQLAALRRHGDQLHVLRQRRQVGLLDALLRRRRAAARGVRRAAAVREHR